MTTAQTLLFLHAHPDDECILTGSILAKAAAASVRTVVVYGSRGDAGETNADLDGEALGDRRVREATAACADLGVDRIVWLDYADSGMADTETTTNPKAFCNADPDQVAQELVTLLADEDIYAVVGYDDNGTYGHPDHRQIHALAHACAAPLKATWVLDATYNREYLATLPDSDGTLDPNFAAAEADLTHFVAGDRWTDAKIKAIANHRSQVPEDWDTENPDFDGFRLRFGTEWFITAPVATPSTPVESADLDLGLLARLLEPKSAWVPPPRPSS